MKTIDFEKAIKAIGAEILGFRYYSKTGGTVVSCVGKMNELTFIKWDDAGRAFVYNQDPEGEDCVSEYNINSLPYERDNKFDLKFE